MGRLKFTFITSKHSFKNNIIVDFTFDLCYNDISFVWRKYMEKSKTNLKKIIIISLIVILVLGLLVSVGFNIYMGLCFIKQDTYLQDVEEIYIMEAGIIKNNLDFHEGTDIELQYDFSHSNFEQLKKEYKIENIAKGESEFEKALSLMNEFAPRLTHQSNYDNHVPQSSLELLAYSLDNKNHGINCRAKAQILNEMCLSLGIYARKVWIMPYSGYDGDCHVVNEIWDNTLEKWIMLDITNNQYWVDENKVPLSVLEIRSKVAKLEFCTPVEGKEKTNNLQGLKDKHIGDFIYIVKNMVYMEYCTSYTVGESKEIYLLMPKNIPTKYNYLISLDSVLCSPIK